MATSTTFCPFRSQVKRLMIERGISLPSASLRWPDSILWLISALMVTTSPALADLGTLTRGLESLAMSSVSSLTAAAADGDLDVVAGLADRAVRHFGDRDHVLGLRQADAGGAALGAGRRAKGEGRDRGFGVAGCQQHHSHGAGGVELDRNGVAVLGDLGGGQGQFALGGGGAAGELGRQLIDRGGQGGAGQKRRRHAAE